MAKVITVRQPHAQLIVQGDKKYETRPFKTLYRGELFIHSSSTFEPPAIDRCLLEPFKDYIYSPYMLKTGFIIGKVQLVDCIPTVVLLEQLKKAGKVGELEIAFGDYAEGRWGWKLENPVQFKSPLWARGKLSIWECEIPTIESLQEVEHG